MSPMRNGNLTAAELDQLIVAEQAYDAAKAEGKPEDEALEIGRAAARKRREEQVLERVGVPPRKPCNVENCQCPEGYCVVDDYCRSSGLEPGKR